MPSALRSLATHIETTAMTDEAIAAMLTGAYPWLSPRNASWQAITTTTHNCGPDTAVVRAAHEFRRRM